MRTLHVTVLVLRADTGRSYDQQTCSVWTEYRKLTEFTSVTISYCMIAHGVNSPAFNHKYHITAEN